MGKKGDESKSKVIVKSTRRSVVNNVNSVYSLNHEKTQHDMLNCVYTNADSLSNKLDELKRRVKSSKVDVIGITEVYPKNYRFLPGKAELHIEGFNIFFSNGTGNLSRGVVLYIRDGVLAEECHVHSNFKESVWVSIKLQGNDKLLIGCIYKSPNCDVDNLNELNSLISKVTKIGYSHILIMGDFNFPKINWSSLSCNGDEASSNFLECVRDNFLYQHVREFTRTRVNSEPSMLDLIFTNEEDMVQDVHYLSPLGHSDHCVIQFTFRCYFDPCTNVIRKYNFFKGNYVGMSQRLDCNWETLLQGDDVNKLTDKFMQLFNQAVNEFVPSTNPQKIIKAKKHNYLPLDDKIVSMIKRKHRCWQRYMETRDEKKYHDYTRLRNQVKNLVRKAKVIMEKDIAKNIKSNPKKFWQYANSKRKIKMGIPNLKISQAGGEIKMTKDDSEKAEVLAKFFSSVFTAEPAGPVPFVEPVQVVSPCVDKMVKECDVLNLLQDLDVNKSPGPDGLHPKALKELAQTITKPLTKIFNLSLSTGKVPDVWKVGNITALFKKGDKALPGNYRPVSLTSVACKLLEKIIRSLMVDHMKMNNLFSDRQFGFISGRSTTLQLLKVMDIWTKVIDNGGCVDTVYMDFMKAFDKVPHRRLMEKLRAYGFSIQIRRWIEDFLNGRSQKVIVNGVESSEHAVTSGIPQGSVLGPILFVIYINDLPQCVDGTAYLFADDTKIFKEIRSMDDIENLQNDLDQLQSWSDKWLLKFHPDKCKVLTVSLNRYHDCLPRSYHLYGDSGDEVFLEKSDCEKDIGVLVDSGLGFSEHIQHQVNKANSIMGLIRRTYTFLDEQCFKLLFQALVRPHLEYAAAVWSPHYQRDIDAIENVQRRATKLIPSLKGLTYTERLKKLKLPTLKYRRLRGDMIEVFKIVSGVYDRGVTEGFLKFSSITHTRGHSRKLLKEFCRLNIRKFSFVCRVVDIWNSLPESVVSATTVFQFEKALDRFWAGHEMLYNYKADFL